MYKPGLMKLREIEVDAFGAWLTSGIIQGTLPFLAVKGQP